MSESSFYQQLPESINNLGRDAQSFLFWNEGSFEDLQRDYESINTTRDDYISRAVGMELFQLELAPALTIDTDGALTLKPDLVTDEFVNQGQARNMLSQFGYDRTAIDALATSFADEESGATLADIDAALTILASRDVDSSAAETPDLADSRRALEFMRAHFSEIAAASDADRVGEAATTSDAIEFEDVVAYAAQNDVELPTDTAIVMTTQMQNYLIEHARERSSSDGEETAQNEDISAVPPGPPDTGESTESAPDDVQEGDGVPATYEVQAGDGFDRIAKNVLLEVLGEMPSEMFRIRLSERIAELNDNDRNYSGGAIHPGQTINVPTEEEIRAMLAEEGE